MPLLKSYLPGDNLHLLCVTFITRVKGGEQGKLRAINPAGTLAIVSQAEFTMNPIPVLIIDDHPTVRQALAQRLSSVPAIQILATAATIAEGLQKIATLRPVIVILETKTQNEIGTSHLDAVLDLIADPRIAVIVLTSYLDEIERAIALQAGACRYLLKDINSAQLIAEIEAVAREIGNAIVNNPCHRSFQTPYPIHNS